MIAAWSPPSATDAEYEVYREGGFNLVMSPRYSMPGECLDIAARHGLKVMVDTYARNGEPWGGTAAEYTAHPTHHPSTNRHDKHCSPQRQCWQKAKQQIL